MENSAFVHIRDVKVINSTGGISYVCENCSNYAGADGFVWVTDVNFTDCIGAGVSIRQNSNVMKSYYIIRNIMAQRCINVKYLAKMEISGSTSTWGSGMSNITAEDLTVIGNDGLVVLGGTSLIDSTLVIHNINIRRVVCGESCAYDAIRLNIPYDMLNVVITDTTAYNLLHIDITGNHHAVCHCRVDVVMLSIHGW